MIAASLSFLRRSLRGTRVRGACDSVGITAVARRFYERRLLRSGVHRSTIAGQRVSFAVSSTVEITRIDAGVEHSFVAAIVDSLRPGDVVYDVGANIGTVAIPVALIGRSRGVQVHAMEPESSNAQRLRWNAGLNRLDNLHVHELALSDRRGEAELFVSGETGTGTHSILCGLGGGRRAVPVRVQRGDEFGERVAIPTVLKIDVEGAEMLVLRGLSRTLERGQIREVFLELHPDRLQAAGSSTQGLLRWMERRGYRWRLIDVRGGELHYHFNCGRALEPFVASRV